MRSRYAVLALSLLNLSMLMGEETSAGRPIFEPPAEDVRQALQEFADFPKKAAFQGDHDVHDLTLHFDVPEVYPGAVSREKLAEEQRRFQETGVVPDAAWVDYWMSKSDDEIVAMISPENPRALVPNYVEGTPVKQGNYSSLVPIWGKPNRYRSVIDGTEWGPGMTVKNPGTGEMVTITDDGWGWTPPEGFPNRSPFKFVAAYRNYLIRKLVYYPYNGEVNFDGPDYKKHASPVYALAYAYAVTRDQKYADRVLLILNRLAENYRHYRSNEDTGWGWGWYPWRAYIDDHNFECGFIINMALAYDLVWDAIPQAGQVGEFFGKKQGESVTPQAVRENIEKNLFGYTWEFVKRAIPGSGGNMLMRQLQTALVLANVFRNDHILDYVVSGPKGLNNYIIGSFYRDGSFWEDSSGYGGMHVRQLILDSDAQLKNYRSPGRYAQGVKLDPAAEQTLAALRAWPEVWHIHGRTLGIGDTHVPRQPVFTPEPPPAASTDGREIGLSLLRLGNAGKDQEHVLLYHGNSGFGHGHYHQLMMKIFAEGYDFSADLGYPANFSSPKWEEWTKATLSHNTVVVNERTQELATASLGIRADGPWASVASAYSRNVYQGVSTYHRTVILLDVGLPHRLVVDIFRVRGGQTHDYPIHSLSGAKGDNFRLTGDVKLTEAPGTLAGPEVAYGAQGHEGYSYLTRLARGPVTGGFSAQWQPDAAGTISYRATIPAGFDGEVITARGESEGNPGLSPWDAYLLLRREGSEPLSSAFVVVYDVIDGAAPNFTVEQIPWKEKDPADYMPVSLRITLADGKAWEIDSVLGGSPRDYDQRGLERLRISGPRGVFKVNWEPSLLTGKIVKPLYEEQAVVVSSERDLAHTKGATLFIKNPAYTKTTSFDITQVKRIAPGQWQLTLGQNSMIAQAVVKERQPERGEIISERISEKLFAATSLFDGKPIRWTGSPSGERIRRADITPISGEHPVQKLRL